MNRRGWNQLFGGLLLIGIGAYFILHEMGIVQPSLGRMIATFWPVILIWVGLQGMFNQRDNAGGFIGSLIPLIIGLFFLGRNLDLVYFSLGDMIKLGLPVVLIGYGLYVIFKPRNDQPPRPPKTYDRPPVERDAPFPEVPEAPKLESSLDEMFEQTFGTKNGKEQPREPEPEFMHERPRRREYKQDWNWGHGDTVNKSAFIGDIHMGQDYFTLKPTNVSQFIGDTVLDLTKAQIPYGETKINISAFIGDVKVFVPNDSDIGVYVTTNSFIGDMSVIGQTRSGFMSNANLESPDYREAGKKLRINVSVFIGDVKVNKVG